VRYLIAMEPYALILMACFLLLGGCADDTDTPQCTPVCEGKNACAPDGCGGECAPCYNGSPRPPGRMGEVCREDSDCISNFCLESEYGPPFCTRPCEVAEENCPAGPDAEEGESLCVSYGPETLELITPPPVPVFRGEETQFCVKRCTNVDDCQEHNLNWEECRQATFLGLPIHPSLGSIRVCQAPSYHGKEPVDPATCDWEKTVPNKYMSHANLCRTYCSYLQTCQEVPADHPMNCCEWGCFNRIIDASIPKVNDAWYDEIKCFIDNHAAYPAIGAANFCSEPPKQCKKEPDDPTPPAADDTWWSIDG
jgi:hypothetical protein